MERIVVGIDSEAASQVAVDWVIRRARERAVDIRLVTAFDLLLDDPLAVEELLERTRSRIEHAVPGASLTTTPIDGSVMEALVGRSREADLVVVGYHRRRPVLSALAGALSARFAARSHCATVIVPEDWTPRDGSVVLGIGDDDAARTAMEFAANEATHPHRDVDVVHAWQLPTPSWDAVGALVASADDLHDAHQQILADAVQGMRESNPALTIRDTLVEGPAAAALAERSADADLVVVGTHRRGATSGFLLGSTVLDLLPQSHAPVCVVPLLAPLAPKAGVLATV